MSAVDLVMDPFEDVVAGLEHEHAVEAARALSDLAAAPDDGTAWRSWRTLERAWDRVAARDRSELKAAAARVLAGAPDGARRLAVVAKLPG